MALSEATIHEVCKEALQDLKDTYPDIEFPSWRQLNFKVDRGTKRQGVCKYKWDYSTGVRRAVPSAIQLSQYHSSRFEVDNCFRHEVAHWMAGHEAKHGPKWQAWAVKCGTSPDRCTDRQLDVPVKRGYTLACKTEGCNWSQVKQRMCDPLRYPHNYKCPNCGWASLYTR